MDKFFEISKRGSDVKTEIIGGLTTFFAMAYIIVVNPNQVTGFTPGLEGIWNAVYIGSLLVAVIGTLLMALYANMPFAQACGMGLNSFFFVAYILPGVISGGDTTVGYHAGLVTVFVSGVVFLVLTFTGARKYIATAMPQCLKAAISTGIGLFIAFIGFQNVGFIQDNQYTLTQIVDVHGALVNGTFKETALPALLAFLGFLIIVALGKKNIKGNVMIGILVTTVLYYVCTLTAPSFDFSQVGQSFKDFANVGLFGMLDGEAWHQAFGPLVGGVFGGILYVIAFCLVDMFDTVGTLYGTAAEADMLDEDGDPINLNKCMMSDSIATVTGACLGTSTCTTFVESASGVAAGARTGLASLVTAACFFVCLFLSPLASIIPSCATAPALIYVGVLMIGNIKKIDMSDLTNAATGFMTLISMVLSYSISNGIGIGAITYVVIRLISGEYKKSDIVATVIALLFVFKFVMITM